jgi:hypothetical protein
MPYLNSKRGLSVKKISLRSNLIDATIHYILYKRILKVCQLIFTESIFFFLKFWHCKARRHASCVKSSTSMSYSSKITALMLSKQHENRKWNCWCPVPDTRDTRMFSSAHFPPSPFSNPSGLCASNNPATRSSSSMFSPSVYSSVHHNNTLENEHILHHNNVLPTIRICTYTAVPPCTPWSTCARWLRASLAIARYIYPLHDCIGPVVWISIGNMNTWRIVRRRSRFDGPALD